MKKFEIKLKSEKELFDLVKKGSRLPVKKEAEKKLIKFLEYVEYVNSLKDKLLEMIKEEAEKIMPNFTTIEGEKVKITRRLAGYKYEITDEENAKKFVKEFVVKRKVVDTEAVEKFLGEAGKLPDGIAEKARKELLKVEIKK